MNKKSLSKNLVCFVLMGTMLAPNVVSAKEMIIKDESVYVNLSEKGDVENQVVTDWLRGNGQSIEVKDKSGLDGIKNIKGEEDFDKNGENLTWKMEGKDIFYQGTTNKELPLEIKIKYYLDDKEVNPKEIAGKSGKLKIKIEYVNTSMHMENINGKYDKIYAPITVLTVVTLPLENFKNIKSNEGTMISEGNNNIINFVSLPGLKENFNIENKNLNIPNNVEIECDVENFKMSPILITATPKLPEIKSLKEAKNIGDFDDAIKELKDASNKIIDGTLKIKDGSGGLNKGLIDFKSSMVSAKNGSEQLSDGIGKMKEGTEKIKEELHQNPDKISLIRDPKNVEEERKLMDHAFKAKDMDINSLQGAMKVLTAENIALFNKTCKDFKNIDESEILNHPLYTGLNILSKDDGIKNIGSFISGLEGISNIDGNTLKKYNDLLNDAPKINNSVNKFSGFIEEFDSNRLATIKNGLSNENLNSLKTIMSSGEKVKNLDLNSINNILKEEINTADAYHSQTEQLRKEENVKFLESIIDSNDKLSKEEKIKAKELLKGYHNTVDETDKKLKNSQDKISYLSKELNSLGDLQKQFKDNEKSIGELNSVLNENNISYINSTIDQLGKLKEEVSSPEGKNVIKNINEVFSEKNITNMQGFMKKFINIKDDLDKNKDSLNQIKKLLDGMNDPASAKTLEKVKVLQADLNKLIPELGKLQKSLPDDVNNDIKAAPKMLKELTIMQQDLKNNEKILELVKDSLKEENINKANKMLDQIPTLNDGIEKLYEGSYNLNKGMESLIDKGVNPLIEGSSNLFKGSEELYSGVLKFKEEGEGKINSELGLEIEDMDRMIKVKDKLYEMSDRYGTHTGIGEDMEGNVKFIMRTDSIKAPEIKKEKKLVIEEEKKGILQWFKDLLA
ncbi:hypothetical protein [uncultured Clostridium sp.]|uniref:hypothetical protein n=1 Tax=uncultured Clostridium sp. TaxID=59620 RepID=UPI0028E49DAB|nr:hypothetical protein [uncultured Clostridium sp.]